MLRILVIMKFITALLLGFSSLCYAQEILVPYRKGTAWGYADTSGVIKVPPKYEEAGQFFNGLAWVKKDGFYHYINSHGRKAFKGKFVKAGDFDFGPAEVRRKGKQKDEQINTKGKIGKWVSFGPDVILTDHFDFRKIAVDLRNFHRTPEFYASENGDSVVFTADYFRGFRSPIVTRNEGISVEHALLRKNGKYGVINEDGAFVIPISYDSVVAIEDFAFKVMKDSKWAYFDRAGKPITGFIFDKLGNFWEQGPLRSVKRKDHAIVVLDKKYGFIDTSGHVFIPCKYDFVWPFKDNLARVLLDGKTGYISKTGREYFED